MRLYSRGDTIVEVLIAITVVSAILAGAFVSSNRSLTVTRQSQERGEAIKLAEGQLEYLKAQGRTAGSLIYTQTDFCLDSGGVATSCDITPAGSGATYEMNITKDPPGAVAGTSPHTFTITILWDKAGGGGEDRLSLVYQLYEP
jgi:type II secretory pathway pseudopilin PulG